jgi:hypothetical protein
VNPISRSTTPLSMGRSTSSHSGESTRAPAGRAGCSAVAAASALPVPNSARLLKARAALSSHAAWQRGVVTLRATRCGQGAALSSEKGAACTNTSPGDQRLDRNAPIKHCQNIPKRRFQEKKRTPERLSRSCGLCAGPISHLGWRQRPGARSQQRACLPLYRAFVDKKNAGHGGIGVVGKSSGAQCFFLWSRPVSVAREAEPTEDKGLPDHFHSPQSHRHVVAQVRTVAAHLLAL